MTLTNIKHKRMLALVGPNYGPIMALDVAEKICKQFKIDRISEVVETHRNFQHKDLNDSPTWDIFGITGKATMVVTLNLNC